MTNLDTSLPIFGTQGGGYATWDADRKQYVWQETPEEFPEFKVGDPIPEMWDVIPANQAARDDMFGNDDFDDSDEVDDVTLGDYDDPNWTDEGVPPPFSLADSV